MSSSALARQPWTALPEAVRAEVERRCGETVVSARTAPGGFSVGFAGVLGLASGEEVFVKAGDGATNAKTAELHRREAAVAAMLPNGIRPPLRWHAEVGAWVVLAYDAVPGRHPGSPWTTSDLDLVLAHARDIGAHRAPAALPSLSDQAGEVFTGWSLLAAEPAPVPRWAHPLLDDFVAWEREAPAAVQGDGIVHLDLRSDNILIDGSRVEVVDWPHASIGAPFVDVVLLAPTVALEGGPPPHEVWTRSGARADATHLRTVVTGWAGRMLWAGAQPDPPGIPHLRAFQRAQAEATLGWLRTLLD